MKIKGFIIFLVVFVILILTTLLFFNHVFRPSWISYSMACIPEKAMEFEEMGIIIAGMVEFIEDPITGETEAIITISEGFEENKKVLRHEFCHVYQFERHNSSDSLSCEKPIKKYLSESECYLVENFPDWIYTKLYGEFN